MKNKRLRAIFIRIVISSLMASSHISRIGSQGISNGIRFLGFSSSQPVISIGTSPIYELNVENDTGSYILPRYSNGEDSPYVTKI